MPPHRTLLSFGTGPGISTHLVSKFVSKGFTHVILLARNTTRLTTSDAPFIAQTCGNSTIKIDTLYLDLADLASIPSVLEQIDDLTKEDEVEVVFFNAARIKATEGSLDVGVGEIEEDFKVCTFLHLES
jgi:short-subunit dehydrogenase